MLASVYSYRVMVKSVSSCCVRGRWVLSNPVTYATGLRKRALKRHFCILPPCYGKDFHIARDLSILVVSLLAPGSYEFLARIRTNLLRTSEFLKLSRFSYLNSESIKLITVFTLPNTIRQTRSVVAAA